MKFLVYILLLCCITVQACQVSQQDVWSCLTNKKHCLTPVDLHNVMSAKGGRLAKPMLLLLEGRRYHRLFENCDVNRDGCIDMHDIDNAGPDCMRSCLWYKTVQSLAC